MEQNGETEAHTPLQRRRARSAAEGRAIRSGLESCGLAVEDSLVVLRRLAAGEDMRAVAHAIATGELLTKRTAHGRRHLLTAVRRRYLPPAPPLPPAADLVVALEALPPGTPRAQLVLPYLLAADVAAARVVDELVLPRLAGRERLEKAAVVEALRAQFRRARRRPWSSYLCQRWGEGLLSVLREVGAVGQGAERERLLPYTLRPEVFCFHLFGAFAAGLRGRALLDAPFFRHLLLTPEDVRRAMIAVAERRWWRYTALGAADEILPVYASPTEWVSHELG